MGRVRPMPKSPALKIVMRSEDDYEWCARA